MAVVLLIIVFISGVFAGTYSGGTGEANDPYRIATAEDLNDIGNHIEDFNKCFVMVADINLAGYAGIQFNIIGTSDNPFTGVFDGNGHTISNFTYTSGADNVGLFGYSSSSTISNLHLINSTIEGGGKVGGLIGRNNYGLIDNSSVIGNIKNVSGGNSTGGLIGINDYGTVTNCHFIGNVSGYQYTGGLIGRNYGPVTNSFSSGNIIGGVYALEVGGLIGENNGTIDNSYSIANEVYGEFYAGGLIGSSWGTIKNCYSTGNVSGVNYIGGLIGDAARTIINSYATGNVTGTGDSVGGLIGRQYLVTCTNSYWDIETSGQTTSAAGIGKSTAEMKQISTFTNWDFVLTWGIEDNQTYPFLKLTYPVGDLNYDKVVNFLDLAILASHWLECGNPFDPACQP